MQGLVFDTNLDQWETSKGFRKQNLPEPKLHEPEDSEFVIVKVAFAGVCGSDRGMWFRNSFKDMLMDSLNKESKTARIVGHECFGEIVAAGSAVETKYGFKIGDTVSAESHVTCGRCFQCRSGELNVCVEEKILGISTDGVFAQYVKLPAKVLWLTDAVQIRPEIAAMQDPFGNAVHACTKVDLRGKKVAIFGCGPIGLFAVLVARALGASQIIGVEPNENHRELAKALGADLVLPITKEDKTHPWEYDKELIRAVLEHTNSIGVDVALEMAGFNSSVNNAVASVRRGGDVILFGIKSGDFMLSAFDRMIVRGVTLHSVIGRQIFKTWYVTKSLLEDKANGIQDKIWKLLLKEGTQGIIPFESYDPIHFEKELISHPKIILKFTPHNLKI